MIGIVVAGLLAIGIVLGFEMRAHAQPAIYVEGVPHNAPVVYVVWQGNQVVGVASACR